MASEEKNANSYDKTSGIPAGSLLIIVNPVTNGGTVIALEDATKQILSGLTGQTFTLKQGTKTVIAALDELYGNTDKGSLEILNAAKEATTAAKTATEELKSQVNHITFQRNAEDGGLDIIYTE